MNASSVVINNQVINSPIVASAITVPLASGAGHVAGGTTYNLLSGQPIDQAFKNSFDNIGSSVAMGTALGVTSTIAVSYANRVSPFSSNIRLASGAQRAMDNPERNVPIKTLEQTIKNGLQMPDPKGSEASAFYGQEMINGKMYNLKVVYNGNSKTIYHFHYQSKAFYNSDGSIILNKINR